MGAAVHRATSSPAQPTPQDLPSGSSLQHECPAEPCSANLIQKAPLTHYYCTRRRLLPLEPPPDPPKKSIGFAPPSRIKNRNSLREEHREPELTHCTFSGGRHIAG